MPNPAPPLPVLDPVAGGGTGRRPGAAGTAMTQLLGWMTRADLRRGLLSASAVGAAGVSEADAWLLGRIVEHGPIRPSALARLQAAGRTTMTAQVQRLQHQGLVHRAADPTDGRAVLISATPAGRAVAEENTRHAGLVLDGLLDAWTQPDKDELVRLVSKLLRLTDNPGRGLDADPGQPETAQAVTGSRRADTQRHPESVRTAACGR